MRSESEAAAHLVTALGGRMIDSDIFLFELPMEQVRAVVPKLCDALPGIGVEKVSERRDQCDSRYAMESVVTLKLVRREPQEPDAERSLLGAMAHRQTR